MEPWRVVLLLDDLGTTASVVLANGRQQPAGCVPSSRSLANARNHKRVGRRSSFRRALQMRGTHKRGRPTPHSFSRYQAKATAPVHAEAAERRLPARAT